MDQPVTLESNIGFLMGVWRELTSCECCHEGELVWTPEDQPDEYLHGTEEEVTQCEEPHIEEFVRRGLVPRAIYKKATCGHEWYGSDLCIECQEKEEN